MNIMPSLDWSQVQTLLAVAEAGSLSGAARVLGISQPTLGRQVKAAEAALGVVIFRRHPRGLALTEAGAALIEPARDMAAAAARLKLAAAGHDMRLGGTVRLTASFAISQQILPPLLAQLRHEEPGIEIELHPADTSDNLLYGEADIALRMYRPDQLDMIARHLGDISLGIFAGRSYADRRGLPETEDDLFRYDWVGLDRSDLMIRGFREMGRTVDRSFFGIRCDDQNVCLQLVRAGCGLGIFQAPLGARDPDLLPVLPGFPLPVLPLWLTAHESVLRIPRVRRVWDILVRDLPAATGARRA